MKRDITIAVSLPFPASLVFPTQVAFDVGAA